MRHRVLAACFVALVMVLTLRSTAFAHDAGPCADGGEPGNSDFAQHYIMALAHGGDLGEADHDEDDFTHNPGSHRGYSACDPSGS